MWQRLWRPLTLGIGGLLGSTIAFWGLGKMLTGVWQQQTFAIESPLLLWIHEQANPILDGVMLMITKLGNKEVLIVVAIATISILWWRSSRQSEWTFLIACLVWSKPVDRFWALPDVVSPCRGEALCRQL
ncbi:MAG: hypothetical protein GDA56_02375 [Hormoscilla sp. GM7CHS1pb]|nr:hypothetical protein [Hormoscilla sp. GM7CHS1pb]